MTYSFGLPKFKIDQNKRNNQLDIRLENSLKNDKNYSLFVNIISKLLFKFIPRDYLEGYKYLKQSHKEFHWNKVPKAIFTTNSYSSDDVFKEWSASCIEKGTKLFIGQHGGNYGMALWNFIEYHQKLISDYFLTWGWSEQNNNKIIPFGIINKDLRKNTMSKRTISLLVEMSIPRYSYHMFSFYVSQVQFNKYFNDQLEFINNLPDYIKKTILVRLKSNDYGLDQKYLWSKLGLNLDFQTRNMRNLKNKSKVYISTYNATTYLESLNQNIPTIIFWDPFFNELRKEAHYFFELLRSVNIFHDNPIAAAQHLERIWNDIDSWWFSENVQEVRKLFCENYCRYHKNHIYLSKIIKS